MPPGDAAGWQAGDVLPGRVAMSVSPLKKVKREAAAQRRPAQSERKNRVFSAKRQAVWFETQRVSTWKCSCVDPNKSFGKDEGEREGERENRFSKRFPSPPRISVAFPNPTRIRRYRVGASCRSRCRCTCE